MFLHKFSKVCSVSECFWIEHGSPKNQALIAFILYLIISTVIISINDYIIHSNPLQAGSYRIMQGMATSESWLVTNGTMTSWIITKPFLLEEYNCWNITTIIPRICPMIFDTDYEPSKRWKSWTMMETPTMIFLSSLPFLFAKGVRWFNDRWIVSSSKSLSIQSKTGLNQKVIHPGRLTWNLKITQL